MKTMQTAVEAAMVKAGITGTATVVTKPWGFIVASEDRALAERAAKWIQAFTKGRAPNGAKMDERISVLNTREGAEYTLSTSCACPRCKGQGYTRADERDCYMCVGTRTTTHAHLEWLQGHREEVRKARIARGDWAHA